MVATDPPKNMKNELPLLNQVSHDPNVYGQMSYLFEYFHMPKLQKIHKNALNFTLVPIVKAMLNGRG